MLYSTLLASLSYVSSCTTIKVLVLNWLIYYMRCISGVFTQVLDLNSRYPMYFEITSELIISTVEDNLDDFKVIRRRYIWQTLSAFFFVVNTEWYLVFRSHMNNLLHTKLKHSYWTGNVYNNTRYYYYSFNTSNRVVVYNVVCKTYFRCRWFLFSRCRHDCCLWHGALIQ